MDSIELPTLSDEKLEEVDRVFNLVKNLSSADQNISKLACDEANTYLEQQKIKSNVTSLDIF